MAQVSRKSVVLAKDVQKDEILTMEHLTMKRPGTGLNAKHIDSILGLKVKKKLSKGTFLTWNELL
jgi:sialic acid synthase SpsE